MTEIITIGGEPYQIGEDALVSLKTGERISFYDDDGDALDPEAWCAEIDERGTRAGDRLMDLGEGTVI